jgi:hypothetical protein
MWSTGGKTAETDLLRERIDTVGALPDLRKHEIDRLHAHHECWQHLLHVLLDGGQMASARAPISGGLR